MNAEERERRRLAAVERNKVDAKPVVEALRNAGFAVDSIADLFNKKLDYRDAIPILVEWLPKVLNVAVKESIVRALSVKWAKNTAAASLLLVEFAHAEDSTGLGLRWAIGNALEVLATDEIADEMISFARDPRYGRTREMVVLGLGRLKDARVTDVLIDLLGDDEVVTHAVMALGKLKAKEARSEIERLLNDPRVVVRNEARKALKNIDKKGT